MQYQYTTVNHGDGSLSHGEFTSTLEPVGYEHSIIIGMAFTVAESIMFAFGAIRVAFTIGQRRYEVEVTGACHALNDTGCREHTWDTPLVQGDDLAAAEAAANTLSPSALVEAAQESVLLDEAEPTCDICGHTMEGEPTVEWNGETGNHIPCEEGW